MRAFNCCHRSNSLHLYHPQPVASAKQNNISVQRSSAATLATLPPLPQPLLQRRLSTESCGRRTVHSFKVKYQLHLYPTIFFFSCARRQFSCTFCSAALGMSRVEDLLVIDSFDCELPRSPSNSVSVQEVDNASKNSSCALRRLYSFDIQDDDAKAVPASSPNVCHSLHSSIGDAAISFSRLQDTDVQSITPPRHMIIFKCKALRRVIRSDPSLSYTHSSPLPCPGPTTASNYGN